MVNVTDIKTSFYNNNTNLKDVASNKGAIIAAKEISDKYKKIRDRKIKIKLEPYHEMVEKVKYLMLKTKARELQLKKLVTNIKKYAVKEKT